MHFVDIVNIIKDQLPLAVRTLFNIKVQEWWLTPVKWLHDDAREAGKNHFIWGTTTAQGGSIVETLNYYFDPEDQQIYITDVEWVEEVSVYQEGEPYDDVILWQDSEDISEIEGAEEVYLFSDEDMNAYQFIVWIPAFLDTEAMREQIAAMVDDHKYAGKYYIIEVIV